MRLHRGRIALVLLLGACAARPRPDATPERGVGLLQEAATAERGEPLFMLDGKEISATAGRAIAPASIASVEVIKGAAATARFGDRGDRGVILITSKPTTPALPAPSPSPSRTSDSLTVLALADTALAAITRTDFVAFTDLMIPEATIIATVAGPDGAARVRARTRETERATRSDGTLTERGFGATAQVAGNVATVWMPYDFYTNGAWSHCGVDVFTMVRRAAGWRIASLAYSVEQPPACRPHPAGPPR